MNPGRIEIPFGAQNLIIESGKLAKQANGAVLVTYGGTIVLVTACMSAKPREGVDFFPLMVEYQEKTYSAGRIPGGFFKREGRPTQKEILTSRVIDRPIRPLFSDGFFNEVQVVATVLSSDGENDPDVLALVGASAALMVSDIPFDGPIAGVRVGMLNGEFILNPTYAQRNESQLDFIVAGHKDGLVMIEGESHELPEGKIVEALNFAHQALIPIAAIQHELAKKFGKPKTTVALAESNTKLIGKVNSLAKDKVKKIYKIAKKEDREKARLELMDELVQDLSVYDECKSDEKDEVKAETIQKILDSVEYDEVRRMVFEEKKRADGRGLTDIRSLSCEIGGLPRTHGAGLFTRGQTQSLSIVTLGTKRDEQLVEGLEGTSYENFLLHYNFPSFSVGETKPMRGPGRREIGHGALAAKALKAVIPSKEQFPYTIRIVSEILESNGSSSMATVCAGSLSLMDAGVPVKDAVAGISIGLITQGEQAMLLTDIMGMEDHFGDMDFKIAGTKNGVTAIQLDLKIKKISLALLEKGLAQAKDARMKILQAMNATISTPRADLSSFAPRIMMTQVPVEKIGEVIGPSGKMIKKIMEQSGATSIDIDDDGKVHVAATSKEAAEKAIAMVKGITEEPEIGRIYPAVVKRIMNFGAFVEFLPGKEGLVHVSELSTEYVKDVNDAVKVGDRFNVKLIEVDKMNRVNLSKKQAEQK